MITQVDFWLDPACPWTWMTSCQILEVEKARGMKATFHIMSLYILNEGRDLGPGYRECIDVTLVASRVAVVVQKLHGHDVLYDFYTALGARLYLGSEPVTVETAVAAFADRGLETGIAERVTIDEFDTGLHAYQKVTQDLVRADVGTLVIRINGMALFGPVISPAPKGEAADELFDGFVKVATYPGLSELKRFRDVDPIFD